MFTNHSEKQSLGMPTELDAILIASSYGLKPIGKDKPILGLEKDIQVFRNHFGGRGMVVPTTKFIENSTMTKNQLLFQIEKYLYHNSGVCRIFYTGHGNQKGNWKPDTDNQKDQLFLQDILKLWRKHKNNRQNEQLHIIMDSCYSGHWIDDVFDGKCDLLEFKRSIFGGTNSEYLKGWGTIMIWASSRRQQISRSTEEGGKFFQFYFKNCQGAFKNDKDQKDSLIIYKCTNEMIDCF